MQISNYFMGLLIFGCYLPGGKRYEYVTIREANPSLWATPTMILHFICLKLNSGKKKKKRTNDEKNKFPKLLYDDFLPLVKIKKKALNHVDKNLSRTWSKATLSSFCWIICNRLYLANFWRSWVDISIHT